MKKFTAIITIMFLLFIATGAPAFATAVTPDTNFLSSPKDDNIVTVSPSVVFAGKGVEGAMVSIQVFQKIAGEYKLVDDQEFTIESLGIFTREVTVYSGDNRVLVRVLKGRTVLQEEMKQIKYNPKVTLEMENLLKDISINTLPRVGGKR